MYIHGDNLIWQEIESFVKKNQKEIERPHWHALGTPRVPSVASTWYLLYKIERLVGCTLITFLPPKLRLVKIMAVAEVTAKKTFFWFNPKCGNQYFFPLTRFKKFLRICYNFNYKHWCDIFGHNQLIIAQFYRDALILVGQKLEVNQAGLKSEEMWTWGHSLTGPNQAQD